MRNNFTVVVNLKKDINVFNIMQHLFSALFTNKHALMRYLKLKYWQILYKCKIQKKYKNILR